MIFLVLLFIVLPIAELYVIIQVGQAIGVIPTLLLLLVDGFLGAALARSQGRAAWLRFNQATAEGRIPAKEVFDGAAIVFGGALLLSPGFITDILGLALLLPFTRAIFRRFAVTAGKRLGPARGIFTVYDVSSRARRAGGRAGRPGGWPPPPPGGSGPGAAPPRRSTEYDVEGTAREVPEDPPELEGGRDG